MLQLGLRGRLLPVPSRPSPVSCVPSRQQRAYPLLSHTESGLEMGGGGGRFLLDRWAASAQSCPRGAPRPRGWTGKPSPAEPRRPGSRSPVPAAASAPGSELPPLLPFRRPSGPFASGPAGRRGDGSGAATRLGEQRRGLERLDLRVATQPCPPNGTPGAAPGRTATFPLGRGSLRRLPECVCRQVWTFRFDSFPTL